MPYKIKPTSTYSTWVHMRQRCNNPKSKAYKDYGGRGIRVCERWSSYANFLHDMGERPEGLSIERIDNDGDYSPSNCKWATRTDQQRNRRVTKWIYVSGEKYNATELAKSAGLKLDTILKRSETLTSIAEITDKKRRVYVEGLALGGKANGARKRSMTHCKRGHEFTVENTRITKQGWRNCRICAAAKERRRTAKKRAQSLY